MTAHGILLRHFHNHRHPADATSLGGDDLRRLIECVGPRNIIAARDWMDRRAKGQLVPTDVCLSFDDNLRCQFDVAYPVLKEYGITAFWFAHTAVLEGQFDVAEIGRYLRLSSFHQDWEYIEAYVGAAIKLGYAHQLERAGAIDKNHLPDGAARAWEGNHHLPVMIERALPAEAHAKIAEAMLNTARISTPAINELLWMDAYTLKSLHERGHVIGLHTHTHNESVASLPVSQQREEYAVNQEKLSAIIGEKPTVMSHPSSSYGPQTLEILKDLGIEMGFRSDMSLQRHGPLEFPRQVHAWVVRRLAA